MSSTLRTTATRGMRSPNSSKRKTVLALTLTSLLQRELHGHGIDLSLASMLEQLAAIKEIFLVYPKQPGPHPPKTASCLSTLDEEQNKIYSALNLARYAKIPA